MPSKKGYQLLAERAGLVALLNFHLLDRLSLLFLTPQRGAQSVLSDLSLCVAKVYKPFTIPKSLSQLLGRLLPQFNLCSFATVKRNK